MASSRIALLCFLGLLVASPAIADSGIYYQLALMWPGAYCEQTNGGCCKPSTGVSPARDFYISGFTVYNATTDYPVTGCNDKTPFDPNAIVGIQGLYQYWSNIKCPSNNGRSSWKNAWKNSGVCSGLNETTFFQTALSFRSRINPLVRLKAKSIAPDFGLYGVKAIKNVFKAGINASPLVQCSMGPSQFGKYQLYQLFFCASESGKFIDCPVESKFTCPVKEIIFHPFQKWMLKQSAKAAYDAADPFVLPGVAMDE
ncbi:Intracellular ribonuclease LX [Dichanthelium oligosanthes]|uniref:Intracellular ribonuclease LX n=1 Tax=Dichanthelium oligosanthes TaxID=888268 RepID=A0A1E5UWN2_9POAL|nr:Intracellular ribonuclease LX [Dichanthelium oligosanthes]